jgi:hypothetical protein
MGRAEAASAQPPRDLTLPSVVRLARAVTAHTIGSALDTPGALLEGLRCFRLTARFPARKGRWERGLTHRAGQSDLSERERP